MAAPSPASVDTGALDSPNGIAFDPVNKDFFVDNGSSSAVAEFTATGVLINHRLRPGLG